METHWISDIERGTLNFIPESPKEMIEIQNKVLKEISNILDLHIVAWTERIINLHYYFDNNGDLNKELFWETVKILVEGYENSGKNIGDFIKSQLRNITPNMLEGKINISLNSMKEQISHFIDTYWKSIH